MKATALALALFSALAINTQAEDIVDTPSNRDAIHAAQSERIQEKQEEQKKIMELMTYEGFLEENHRKCLTQTLDNYSVAEQVKLCQRMQRHLTTPKAIEPGKLLYLFIFSMELAADGTEDQRREFSQTIFKTLTEQ